MVNFENFLRELSARADGGLEDPTGLHGSFYTSQQFFEYEKNAIFRSGWHCLGREDEIPEPGDYFTAQRLNEPLLVVRGDDLKIRVFANVCRHRGMMLAEGRGNTRRFVCSYHAWSYNRDGGLARAPHMKNDTFDPDNCRLSEFVSIAWQGFIYVNLGEKCSDLSSELDELSKQLEPYETGQFRLVHVAEEEWGCNWKCLVENFMEGYHLSVVHPQTLRGYTPTELCKKGPSSSGFTSYFANYPDDIPSRGSGAPGLNKEQQKCSFLFSVFPTQVASQAASLLASLYINPLAVDRISVKWTLSVYKDDLDAETIKQRIALWTEVNREDREKLERLQIALNSSRAEAGPLAGEDFEGTIHDFHKYLARSCATAN